MSWKTGRWKHVSRNSGARFSANASSRDVSRTNSVRVLEYLREGGAVSRVDVARATVMSPATVNRLTTALLEMGLVKEAGSDDATGGRPSLMVRFNPDARLVLAVDIDEKSLDIAEVNLDGRIRNRESLDISGLTPPEKLDHMVEVIGRWISSCPAGAPYVSVGISIPGPVDDGGVVTLAPALGWYGVPVRDLVEAGATIPVTVENDVNLLAYAEYSRGGWGPVRTLMAIGVFQGVGAGIVENGHLWRGIGGAAGQLGRMLVDVSGLERDREGFGQVETRLGSSALLRRAVEAEAVPPTATSPDALFRAVAEGNERAKRLLEAIADEYSLHLVNLCAIVAPDMVVFSGLFERWSSFILPMLADRLHGNVLHEPRLLPAALGMDGKLIGAGLFALDRLGGIASLVG